MGTHVRIKDFKIKKNNNQKKKPKINTFEKRYNQSRLYGNSNPCVGRHSAHVGRGVDHGMGRKEPTQSMMKLDCKDRG